MYELPLLAQMCWQSCPWAHASISKPAKANMYLSNSFKRAGQPSLGFYLPYRSHAIDMRHVSHNLQQLPDQELWKMLCPLDNLPHQLLSSRSCWATSMLKKVIMLYQTMCILKINPYSYVSKSSDQCSIHILLHTCRYTRHHRRYKCAGNHVPVYMDQNLKRHTSTSNYSLTAS